MLHGGGEPTLHWHLVQWIEAFTREEATQLGVGWFGYIATNGVLSEKKVQWLSGHFDIVGLSCDGPPDIQNQQRPFPNGRVSSPYIERTARVLTETGGQFIVRTTVTPQTVERQAEIVDYLHNQLGATQMRFEPVYRLSKNGRDGFIPDQAGWFVEHFIAAQQKAQSLGCQLTFSGVRLDEIHGPYCNVLRDVLYLTPDGAATACFFSVDSRETVGTTRTIGDWNSIRREFVLDEERIAFHRHQTGRIPDRCQDCINAYHSLWWWHAKLLESSSVYSYR